MRIVIAGGSGQVGRMLAESFAKRGNGVVVLTRAPTPASWRTVYWDGETLGAWAGEVDNADILINLAGRSVNCRYTPANRQQILQSRVRSTRVIGEAIARAPHPPRLWLQAGTATIYAHRFDGANDEATGVIGGSEPNAPDTWRFSIDVAQAWERALDATPTPTTRRVILRTAMVMSPHHGGVFDTLLGLVRRGLGGQAGDGNQFVSWIHYRDFIRALDWLIEHEELEGAVNVAAPHPLPNAEFMRLLREAAGVPIGLPATAWMLEIGARLLGTETELILKSRRVVPGRLTQSGFAFELPEWRVAATDLCREWKSLR